MRIKWETAWKGLHALSAVRGLWLLLHVPCLPQPERIISEATCCPGHTDSGGNLFRCQAQPIRFSPERCSTGLWKDSVAWAWVLSPKGHNVKAVMRDHARVERGSSLTDRQKEADTHGQTEIGNHTASLGARGYSNPHGPTTEPRPWVS